MKRKMPAEDDKKMIFIRDNVLQWGKTNMRDFPWRKTKDPYKILISELMLHRTRAEQVEPGLQ